MIRVLLLLGEGFGVLAQEGILFIFVAMLL